MPRSDNDRTRLDRALWRLSGILGRLVPYSIGIGIGRMIGHG